LVLTEGMRVWVKPVPEPGSTVPLKVERLRAAWSEGASARSAAALATEAGADEALVGRVRREGALGLLSLGRVEKDGHVSARVVVSVEQLRTPEFLATVQRLLDRELPRDGGRPVAELEGADIPPLPARKLAGRILLGVGAAAAGAGIALGFQASALAASAGEVPQDAPKDYARAVAQARATALGADILYGVAGAALVTGVVLMLVPEPPSQLQLITLSPVVLPSGAGLALAGAF